MSKTVSFTQMKDGTAEDYALLEELEKPYLALTADRVLDELRRQGEVSLEGYKITRLDHGLQAATRAERDGADLDWIVGALLHDIGDGLAPQNHDRFSAEVIRPFVRWMWPGSSSITGFSRCSITRIIMAGIGMRGSGSKTIPVLRAVRRSASVGISRVSIRVMSRCHLRISSRWCARSLRGKPMIRM